MCEAVYVNIRSALLRRKFVFLILGTRILTRKAYCPSAKIRFRYTQFLRDSLIPFSQLDILWVILALKVFGIVAVISYGIAVLMKITMACISAMTKEKEVQK